MVSFEAVDSQCIVDNKIVFCNNLPEEQKETMIYLSSQRGGDTLYGTDTTHVVTYPGEYEIDGYVITGYEYSDMIHYIVTLPTEERVAIVHSEDFFDRDDLPSVDMWFSTLENLDTYMEQREIEGDYTAISLDA